MAQLIRTEILTTHEDARVELAKRAESLLGYSALRRHLKVSGDLSAALQLLDIHPLDAGSVTAYMKEMQEAKQQELNAGMMQRGWGSDMSAHWQSFQLHEYHQPVPEFVLSKAIQIKELCPNATFDVLALIVSRRTADPFLVATLGDEKFYVEVWDEPKFESEL